MKVIIVLILVFCCSSINCKQKRQISFPDDDENQCTTPNRKTGKCLPLVQCTSLSNKRNIRLLRASICGFEDDMPKVCCPIIKENIIQTTRKPTIQSTKRKRTTKSPSTTSTASFVEIIDENIQSDSSDSGRTNEKPLKLPENCGNSSIIKKERIVGGKPAIPGAWPWMAAVFVKDLGQFSAQCGGALISDQEIITASHCVVENGKVRNPSDFFVRLGEHNIDKKAEEDAEEDYRVIKVTAHPQFEAKVYKNDIAILKLGRKVRFNSRIWPICLPYNSQVLQSKENVGRLGYITGWGRLSYDGRQSEVLQEAPIQIVSQEDCGKAFESYVKITDVYLCAGTVGATRDSCQGDSGGPLVQTDSNNERFYLTGIVSFGRRCATPGFPGVYARVSHFLNWISKNI